MEHIIGSDMMDYIDTYNILCPQQHGFRSKHSCETQLIGFTQQIADSLDQGQQTDVIVMDFSKEFDKEAAYRTYVCPQVEYCLKGMFKMTITTQAVSQTCSES